MRNLVVSALKTMIYGEASTKMLYADGKATNKVEAIVIKGFIKGGEVQVLLSPEDGLDVRLNSHFSFGDILKIDEIFDVSDIRISIYNGEPTVKYDAEIKEGIL